MESDMPKSQIAHRLTLEIFNRTHRKISGAMFRALLPVVEKCLLKEKKITAAAPRKLSIELTFIGNSEMSRLNAEFHGKPHPTDVISLSYFDKKMDDPFIGEIFICLPYAEQQAKKIRQPFKEELRFLFIHGVLHLFGYDHKKSREEAHMKKLTYQILGRVHKRLVYNSTIYGK